MAVTRTLFNVFKQKQFNGNAVDLDTDTIKVALFTDAVAPTITWDFYDDVSGAMTECSGTGYTAGGATIADITPTGTTTITFDATDIAWTSATITDARYAVIYKSTGTASTSKLMGWIDFGENKSVTAGTFTIQWHASGVWVITSS